MRLSLRSMNSESKYKALNSFQKDLAAAKTFIEENKDQLGEYLNQAQALVSGSEGLNGLVNKVKGLF